MQKKRIRRLVTPIGVGALVGVTMFAGVPAQAQTVDTTFLSSCLATPSAVAGPTAMSQLATVSAEAPASVNAGDEFDVIITPPPISVPNSVSGASVKSVSRIKIDVDIPQNAEYLGGEIVPGTSVGLSGVVPNVLRINESGYPDPSGKIIRLSGNNATIGNGPNTSTGSEGGIVALATSGENTTFKLPQVKARLRAGESGKVEMTLRTGGDSGTWNNDKNFLSFLPKATLVITAWAPTRCTPRDNEASPLNAGAGPLVTTNIIEADKQTTTTIDAAGAVKNGAEVTLTANVAPAAPGGTVEFFDGATSLGTVDVAAGKASIAHIFDTDGDHAITAAFSGSAGFIASTSSVKTINVSTDDTLTTLTMTSPDEAYVGQDVNLRAQVTPAVQGGTVEFTIDGNNTVSGTVGTDGTAVAPYNFDSTGTHKVVARYSGTQGVSGSVAPAFPVSVTNAPPAAVQSTTTLDAVGTIAKGTPVTLRATVDPANANGTVQFKIGSAPLGGPVTVVNGVATLPTTFNNSGEYSITAEFIGAAGFIGSASAPQALTVPGSTDPGTPGDGGSLGDLFGNIFGS
ncbi:Ig-like domain-containing protein [Rhodococcus sp. ARC_M13]|uniref:Ig-like domain-containing protein n=1 Tax=Rhodococcus TaxID=1827 RepID=UPI001FB1A26C|nr:MULTISPECIES: Ig-like domain-containing protein [Rhodococcus]MCJ0898302.1 Ig-like domain-containing protein [Rhodococcus sp. ARC_M13]MCZ4643407.1 Ig-like domain-containing protein [Rhodococcus erythropolis]